MEAQSCEGKDYSRYKKENHKGLRALFEERQGRQDLGAAFREPQREAVVGRSDPRGKLLFYCPVFYFVGEMREDGFPGGYAADFFDSLAYAEVGGVGREAQGADDEDVQVFEQGAGGFGYAAAIRQVGHASDSVAVNVQFAVLDRDGGDGNAVDGKISRFNGVQVKMGYAASDLFERFEDIRKAPPDFIEALRRSVNGDGFFVTEGAKVVDAVQVVGVGVGVENGVNGTDAFAKRLDPQFGGGVDEDGAAARSYQQRGPAAFVFLVF
jgi:hypothetical protein